MHHRLGAAARHVVELLFRNTLGNQVGDEAGMAAGAIIGGKMRLNPQKLGVLRLAHQGLGRLRAHHHLDIDARGNKLLRMHEQRCGTDAAGNQKRMASAIRCLPAMAHRTHKAYRHTGLHLGKLVAAKTHHLIQDNQLALVFAHMEHRKRAAQNMTFHSRDQHMHELAGQNPRGQAFRL